jgi:flagellar protein FliS
MMHRARQTYLTEKILSADPLELVRLLYAAAVEAVAGARGCLARRDIAGRVTAVSKAVEILSELTWSLDHGPSPALSGKLAALYDYMQRRLLEANLRQRDEPLAEVLGLLQVLGEAWQSVAAAKTPPAPHPVWAPGLSYGEPEPALRGWSF